MEAAAGLAGFLKLVLALQRRRLPANLHLQRLNPRLRLEGSALRPLDASIEWAPIEGRRGTLRGGEIVLDASATSDDAPPCVEVVFGDAVLLHGTPGS